MGQICSSSAQKGETEPRHPSGDQMIPATSDVPSRESESDRTKFKSISSETGNETSSPLPNKQPKRYNVRTDSTHEVVNNKNSSDTSNKSKNDKNDKNNENKAQTANSINNHNNRNNYEPTVTVTETDTTRDITYQTENKPNNNNYNNYTYDTGENAENNENAASSPKPTNASNDSNNNSNENENESNESNENNPNEINIESNEANEANEANEQGPELDGIDLERFKRYEPHILESLQEDEDGPIKVLKVKTQLPDESEEKDEIIEKIIGSYSCGENRKDKEVQMTCKICFVDEFSPSELLEYTFDNKRWFLANMCPDCFEMYKNERFKNWKDLIEKPDCEASFRRMLKIGVIANMYDHTSFPSPPDEEDLYRVKDHTGKEVQVPRPVAAMRLWDPTSQTYKPIDPHLTGAPRTDEEKETFWNEMLEKFYMQHGKETIIEWLNASPDEAE